MPFQSTLTRSKADLSAFFEHNIKARLESASELSHRYVVRRSDDTFNINEQIIRDLYTSDVVVADLSGELPNPNVMYELGVRFSVSPNPVILIREQHSDNKPLFDIGGFYAFAYSPHQYAPL